MENTVKSLAGARKEIADLKAKIARLNEAILASPLGHRLERAKELLRDYEKDAKYYRESIDEMAFIYFKADGDKHPHPAVTVNERTSLEYDQADAITWAIDTKQPQFLSIKKSQFEKAAKAGIQIPGVEVKTTLTTSVKRDLAEYL